MPSSDAPVRRPSRWRWGTPLVAASLGVAYLIAGWLGDDLQFGVVGMLVMSGIAAAMLVAARLSETVAGLLDRRDERINLIDTQATVFAGMAVISAVIIGFVVEIARGQDGAPYSMLGAIGGTSYVAALLVLRFRR
jgi:hypothetical protein